MKKRSELSFQVSGRLRELGFDREFADVVGNELNTDFTARQMLGYLRDMQPRRMEEVVDEMLMILALRDLLVQKHIQRGAQWIDGF